MHFKQIHISPSSRGIVDHFFCFIYDEYVWDCDHLIEERLSDPRITALGGSQLQSFAYDGKSPQAVTMTFTYNTTYSQVTSVTDPLGHTTTFMYDMKGNLTSVTDPLGNTSSFTYNPAGQVVTSTDRNGKVTQFSYVGGYLTAVMDNEADIERLRGLGEFDDVRIQDDLAQNGGRVLTFMVYEKLPNR